MAQSDTHPSPFTIIHTSDWHLGHELHGHNRDVEHQLFLDWLLDQIGQQSADAVIVTGDIYDVANPPITAMRRLFAFLNSATQRYPHVQIVILGGNHDSALRIDLPAALLGKGRIHFIGAVPRRDGAPDFAQMMVPLHNAAGQRAAWLAAVPFCRPADLGAMSLETFYGAMLDTAETHMQHEDVPLIVTGHLHVAGGHISEMSERRIVIGGEEAQAASLFDKRASYVALGHLHRPQNIATDPYIRYAGSPIPMSSTERDYKHAISVVRFTGKACTVEPVIIPRQVPFLSIGPIPLEDAVAAIDALVLDADSPKDLTPFLEVSVLVDGPEPHLQTRILKALDDKPVRLMKIARVIASADTSQAADALLTDLADLKPQDVFQALFAKAYAGNAPSEDLLRAFDILLIETENEAN